ncbi:MAG TPA: carboxypeptidase regulatory-like domain-containing protein [Xanthobacteraceae bacterium]|jgi:virginiamycin B lyase|nr:carboxypeptidase regulatory-like domain-containing protein [Xanthobacteraceae bacterium]
MRLKHLLLLSSASAFGLLIHALPTDALAQSAVALTGQVTSAEEGPMEGVLVSAKKQGSTVAVTVVTDAKGQYGFPADRLDAGHYAIAVRAAGYDLSGPREVDIAAGGAKADIKLIKTKNLANQLSNAEWLISAPGPDNLKANLTNCVSCHTLQRVFASAHDADEFKQIFRRMGTYAPGSTPVHPQKLLPGPRGDRSPMPPSQFEATSAWLASVDLNASEALSYELQTLPRPKGASTRVIYTEYDLPRKEAQPHDVIVDRDGMVWYSDFSNQFAGVLDPKTGKATDIPIPVLKPEQPKGSLEIELEAGEKNVWLALMYQAGVARIDRITHEVTMYPYPKEWQSTSAQASMVSPQHADVDGKVWSNNQDTHYVYRLDVKTGQYENLGPSKDPRGKQISAYGMPTDLENNVYQLEFGGTSIGLRDAKTGAVTIYDTPIKNSRPRRGRVDGQNRLWFAEYGGNAIGLFDPKTAAIKEYPLPTKWGAPYDVVPNRDASQVWTGSMLNDRVARLDARSGQFTEYLLPRPTNIRRVFVQEEGQKTMLWVGSNHGASIVKVEPLD